VRPEVGEAREVRVAEAVQGLVVVSDDGQPHAGVGEPRGVDGELVAPRPESVQYTVESWPRLAASTVPKWEP
jgi:hypothetical protein